MYMMCGKKDDMVCFGNHGIHMCQLTKPDGCKDRKPGKIRC